jgi:hypothetical protein
MSPSPGIRQGGRNMVRADAPYGRLERKPRLPKLSSALSTFEIRDLERVYLKVYEGNVRFEWREAREKEDDFVFCLAASAPDEEQKIHTGPILAGGSLE